MNAIAMLPFKGQPYTRGYLKVNYRLLDIDEVLALRTNLMKYLHKRDIKWVPHLLNR